MSVNSLVRMALGPASPPAARGGPPPQPFAAPAAAPAGGDQSPTAPPESLASFVPTEVIAFYTTAIGVLAGVLKDSPNATYLPLRWGLLIGGLVAVAVAIVVPYLTATVPGRRAFVIFAVIAGELSFGAWALVLPGSALYYVLGPPTLPVIVGVIGAAGVFIIAAVLLPIQKKLAAA